MNGWSIFLLLMVAIAFGFWLGGGSQVRINTFADWIATKPWKKP